MFNTVEELKDALCEREMEDAVIFDGETHYSTAVVGFDYCNDRVIYDYDKMVEFLVRTGGGNLDDAIEWIEYNTIRALPYMGEHAPIILMSFDE